MMRTRAEIEGTADNLNENGKLSAYLERRHS